MCTYVPRCSVHTQQGYAHCYSSARLSMVRKYWSANIDDVTVTRLVWQWSRTSRGMDIWEGSHCHLLETVIWWKIISIFFTHVKKVNIISSRDFGLTLDLMLHLFPRLKSLTWVTKNLFFYWMHVFQMTMMRRRLVRARVWCMMSEKEPSIAMPTSTSFFSWDHFMSWWPSPTGSSKWNCDTPLPQNPPNSQCLVWTC